MRKEILAKEVRQSRKDIIDFITSELKIEMTSSQKCELAELLVINGFTMSDFEKIDEDCSSSGCMVLELERKQFEYTKVVEEEDYNEFFGEELGENG